MMNCSINKGAGRADGANPPAGRRTGIAAALCAAFVVMASACTEVDNRLGAGLVPKHQTMEIEVTAPEGGVKTYLYREDSIPSSRTGHGYFGRMRDEKGVFGALRAGVLLQYYASTRPYADVEGYGLDPIIDSALIILSIDYAKGDTTKLQTFDVWEVVAEPGVLHRDSSYYIDFSVDRVKGRKLFQFSHSGKRDIAARLFPTAAGKEYLESLITMKWEDYWTDSLFYLKRQGLYVTPADESPADAAVYGAALQTSGLELHVRNHDTLDVSAIYDTLVTTFSFRDIDGTNSNTGATVYYDNVSINMATLDYTGSVLGQLETATRGFTDTLPTSVPQPVVYVQGMGGVGTYMRFTDEFVETVRSLKYKTDESGQRIGKDIAINQALMKIWVDDPSTAALDGSLKRLGSYLNLKKLLPIPDYPFTTEALKQKKEAESSSDGKSTYVLPYNGYLNRSGGYYELDITAYVQRMARVDEADPGKQFMSPAFFLAPPAADVIGLGTSVLKGSSSDRPITIRITYTIIEG